MTLEKARTASSPWLPAERLGQMTVDARVRPWLIGNGLLTLRMKAVCNGSFALKLADQWAGPLDSEHRSAMRSPDDAGLFQDVEMFHGEDIWVFERTVIPDSTLCSHPWLAELGDPALGETLSALSSVKRSSYEYAWLPAEETLAARALRDAAVKPDGLWARRSRVSVRGAPLLMQEVFMPAVGLV